LPNSRNGPTELDQALAGYLLSLNPGDQLLSIRKLAELYDASVGSISTVINALEEAGAVSISRRGHLGSFLEEKSISALWHAAGDGPMVIGLTLPSFSKCEGLATAIYSLLNGAGIETYLIFMRGSANRLNALRSGHCHAVVMSALAADKLTGPDEAVLLKLPPETFTGEHRVFYRDTAQAPWKVAIDPESLDIRYLTEMEFADSNVEFCRMTFTQIDLHMEDSPVDAAITTSDFLERLTSKGIASRSLSPEVRAIVGDRVTSATLVVNAKADVVRIVLQEILKPDAILAIQQEVIEGRMVPRY
jgi:hypothetical protein